MGLLVLVEEEGGNQSVPVFMTLTTESSRKGVNTLLNFPGEILRTIPKWGEFRFSLTKMRNHTYRSRRGKGMGNITMTNAAFVVLALGRPPSLFMSFNWHKHPKIWTQSGSRAVCWHTTLFARLECIYITRSFSDSGDRFGSSRIVEVLDLEIRFALLWFYEP